METHIWGKCLDTKIEGALYGDSYRRYNVFGLV